MKLYLSSAIIETRKLSTVSFITEQYDDTINYRIELFYSENDSYSTFNVASTDLEADKKMLTKYFKNLDKQKAEQAAQTQGK